MANIKEIAIGQDIYIIKDQNAVSKSGDTMTGALNINAPIYSNDLISVGDTKTAMIIKQKDGASYGASTFGDLLFRDDNDGSVAIIGSRQDTNGYNSLRFLTWDKDSRNWVEHPYIKKTYVDGESGYIIWSNGYCEQWGRTTSNTTTLAKKFANTNYNVTNCSYQGGNYNQTRITGRNTTTITWWAYDGYNILWRACGFLASDQY